MHEFFGICSQFILVTLAFYFLLEFSPVFFLLFCSFKTIEIRIHLHSNCWSYFSQSHRWSAIGNINFNVMQLFYVNSVTYICNANPVFRCCCCGNRISNATAAATTVHSCCRYFCNFILNNSYVRIGTKDNTLEKLDSKMEYIYICTCRPWKPVQLQKYVLNYDGWFHRICHINCILYTKCAKFTPLMMMIHF